jgi:hypothetical protein
VGFKPYENPDADVCLHKSGCENRLDYGDCFFFKDIPDTKEMKEKLKKLGLTGNLPADKGTTTNNIKKT